ncbi:hypothetical protein D8I30_03115 [Brevundimonas naejangsanensis]|uniref:Uncharacterized protein n=1 Tax=Brevundimonas naejangsanensis TaxID=588932 RepID=A0A494RD93_9CAUL|nr:hypothetical protein [Brevundimonas naejangsanensis]AYG94288.1 hypothetical protein D8I30_03115 [Brevundimonas naejangsanensis]
MAGGGVTGTGGAPSTQTRIWGPERFHLDMREAERRERVQRMDVAGRARALVWGPYDLMPAGVWRATATFLVDRWACRHTYRLEWGENATYASHAFVPGREGVFEVSAEYEWRAETGAELRLILAESSLGGVFEFFDVRVCRVDQPPAAT